jgi:hypothetical protein
MRHYSLEPSLLTLEMECDPPKHWKIESLIGVKNPKEDNHLKSVKY